MLSRVTALHRGARRRKVSGSRRRIGGSAEEIRLGDEAADPVILHNLIGNALKFTDRGGVRVEITTDNDAIVIRVSDTGIGMQAEIARAFDEFSQGIDRGAAAMSKLVFGPPIVRRLARLMGGDVALTSVQGAVEDRRSAEGSRPSTAPRTALARALRCACPEFVLAAEDNATPPSVKHAASPGSRR